MSTSGAVAVLGATALAVTVHEARCQVGRSRSRRRLAGALGPTPEDRLPLPAPVGRALHRAGVEDGDRAVLAWLAAVALASLLAVVSAGGRIALVVVLVGPPAALRMAAGRHARRRAGQLPEALDAVGAGLRGGLGLAAAVEAAAGVGAPLGPELAGIGGAVASGLPLEEALRRWRDASTDPATALAGAALGVAAAVGGPGARAVDGAAASLRDRLAADAETDALATQAKASAAVLTAAPLVFAVLLTSLDPTAGRFLLGTPVGWLCITVGLALDLAGACWMAALVRRAR